MQGEDKMMSPSEHDYTPGWFGWLLLGLVIVLFVLALMVADSISHIEDRLDILETTVAEEQS